MRLLLLLFLFCVFTSTGQEKGFYGKRFQISLGAGGNLNLFSNILDGEERAFRKSDNYSELRKKTSGGFFNYSLYAAVGYTLKERLALAVDFNYQHGNALSLRNIHVKYPQSYDCRFQFQSYRFMPRLEISSKNSGSPAGLTYIVGLGAEFTLGISKTYPVNYYQYPTYNRVFKYQHLYFSKTPVMSICALFGAEYRIPVAKWAAFNLGGYANLNVTPASIFASKEYESSGEKAERLMGKARLLNFFSCRAGILFML